MKPTQNTSSLKKAFGNLAKIGVLVVDDDRRISLIVREVLENMGFRTIYMASDGVEALTIMHKEKVDMLITDWKMPPLDGISLIKYLRTHKDSPNHFIPIIMLTGNVEKEHVQVARDIGVTEFVAKPFSAKTLCERIITLIEHPRGFVMNRNFVGPDRRRRSAEPPDNKEKRTK